MTNFAKGKNLTTQTDVVCFSHLRWDFVYQRPQHLMSRFARKGRVFFVEEALPGYGPPSIDVSKRGKNIFVCVPSIPPGYNTAPLGEVMPRLIANLRAEHEIENNITWFYTPMMLKWSKLLHPAAVIYDCMDELSNFKNAPAELCERERRLFDKADLVFTGGQSLYEAKREQHPEVYAFPSSIDKDHFGRAREIQEDIAEQAALAHPRIGFVGVIDERFDIPLLASIADLKSEWNFVMVGPVVKIDQNDLPRRPNIHYLGQKAYEELPSVLAGWDVAMMPFALNDSTRFISPTKTPEFLAAGLPVVSTPITDVIRPYGEQGLVRIASTPKQFVHAIELALEEDQEKRQAAVDEFLADFSWDKTFAAISGLIEDAIAKREKVRVAVTV